jgi:Flp pilus assembly protein TadD
MKSFVKLPSESQNLQSAASSKRRNIVRFGSKPQIFGFCWGLAALATLLLPSAVFARGGGGHGGGHHGGGHHAGGHHGGEHHAGGHHGGEHHAGGHHGGEHHAGTHGNHHLAAHHQWNQNGWHGNHDNWHNNWHHGYWGGWGAYPASWGGGYGGGGYIGNGYAGGGYGNGAGYATGGGYGTGLGTGLGLGAAAGLGLGYAYSNPYWSGDSTTTGAGYNYSQAIPSASTYVSGNGNGNGQSLANDSSDPLPVADGTAEGGALVAAASEPQTIQNPFAAEPTTQQQQALADMDTAREAFKRGDYAQAEQFSNKAVALLPDDTAIHEFRALTMFAQKKYRDAAAGIYAVLSAGPGWNEKTLQSLYADPKTYAGQLQSLETYAKDNPQAADALFLLAYHELTAGKLDVARGDLERVAQLEPKDKVAVELVQALSAPRTGTPEKESS